MSDRPSFRARMLAVWLLFGWQIVQWLGLVAIPVGLGFLFSWPVGLVCAGVELVAVGALMERVHARSS